MTQKNKTKIHELDLTGFLKEYDIDAYSDLQQELGEAYKEMEKFSKDLCDKLESCTHNKIKLCQNLADMYSFLATGYAENTMAQGWFQACQAEIVLRALAREWMSLLPRDTNPFWKHDLPEVLSANGDMYHFYMLFWEFKMAEPDGHPELEVVKGCIEREVK